VNPNADTAIKVEPTTMRSAVLFHGCDKDVAESVLRGEATLQPSENVLALAYEATVWISAAAATPLPVNTVRENGIFMKRQLDCAVIQLVHKIRESKGMEAYDTVYGVFEEGDLVYPGAGFCDRTHVQIAIRNPEMILGYFRVEGMT
jgi:hypothetical protein